MQESSRQAPRNGLQALHELAEDFAARAGLTLDATRSRGIDCLLPRCNTVQPTDCGVRGAVTLHIPHFLPQDIVQFALAKGSRDARHLDPG